MVRGSSGGLCEINERFPRARIPSRSFSANIESQSPFVPYLLYFSHSRSEWSFFPSLSLSTFALDHLNFRPAEREKLAAYFPQALCPPLKCALSIEISNADVSEYRRSRFVSRASRQQRKINRRIKISRDSSANNNARARIFLPFIIEKNHRDF